MFASRMEKETKPKGRREHQKSSKGKFQDSSTQQKFLAVHSVLPSCLGSGYGTSVPIMCIVHAKRESKAEEETHSGWCRKGMLF